MQPVRKKEGDLEGRYLAIGTWLDLVPVGTMPNTKYQEPLF